MLTVQVQHEFKSKAMLEEPIRQYGDNFSNGIFMF